MLFRPLQISEDLKLRQGSLTEVNYCQIYPRNLHNKCMNAYVVNPDYSTISITDRS